MIRQMSAAVEKLDWDQIEAVLTPRFRVSWHQVGSRRTPRIRGTVWQGRPPRDYGDIPAVDSVSDLDPGLPSTGGHQGGLGGAGQGPAPDSHPTSAAADGSQFRQAAPR
jgi:hypothetical protein